MVPLHSGGRGRARLEELIMPTSAEIHAEQCRRELDEMSFYEGTLRRDACIRRHIEQAVDEVTLLLQEEISRLRRLLERAEEGGA
jgi:hypothetical protein